MSNGALAVPTHPHHPQGTMGNLVRRRADKTRRKAAGNYNLPILVLRDVQRLQFAGKTKKQLTNNLIAFEEVLRIKIQPPSWYVNVCVNANDMQIVSVVVSTVTCPDAGKLYTRFGQLTLHSLARGSRMLIITTTLAARNNFT